jgi:zinc protease
LADCFINKKEGDMKNFLTIGLFMMQLNSLSAQADFMHNKIVQTKLDNGLTILVCPRNDVSTVSIQLWYNVGSKHEKDGEHGIAHFIEHMIFKGTKTISETDIPLIASKLSGYCNAFTWHDYTAYLFDIPVANWDKVLPVMADCMSNCTLRQDHLNSEVKAVIQELKMGKDNFARNLREVMITNIFESHPYHYSTIGFKEVLWTVSQESLLAFYKKYYTPDNAVMVIVGDVDPVEAHNKIAQEFAAIPAGNNGWNSSDFYINEDIKSKSITLYRDLQQPVCDVAYVLPGIENKNQFELESFGYALANGKGSRLHKLLVDELQLVVDIGVMVYDMFERAMFFIEFYPKNEADIDRIVQLIQNEIDAIAQGNLTQQEIERAQRCAQIEYQKAAQNTRNQATMIGASYLAHQDPWYAFSYGTMTTADLAQKIQDFAANYCSAVVRHQAAVRAVPQAQKALLARLQQDSDEEDKRVLNAKIRISPIEDPVYALTLELNEKRPCHYSVPHEIKLDNGLVLLWLDTQASDIVEWKLSLFADNSHDADDKQGLAYVMSKLLLEGTKNYSGQAFCDELEQYGMSIVINPGSISCTCLKQDTEKSLEMLAEILINASLQEASLEKIKKQVAMESKIFWDTPTTYGVELARRAVYQNHPYQKTMIGSTESIESITLEDCKNYYKTMLSPQGACFALVGNFADKNIYELVNATLGTWQGDVIPELIYPTLDIVAQQEILSSINRDQIVLAFTGLSVDRMHDDFDKILLFDKILVGGMDTRLFKLRMQSGLFYTIGGSLLFGSTEQPGMIFIKTIVSNDRVDEAQAAILQVLDEAIDTITQEELDSAKRSIITAFDKGYELNSNKVATFSMLKKYNLPFNHYEQRAQALQNITIEQVQRAVRSILSSEKLAVIKIGRVGQ